MTVNKSKIILITGANTGLGKYVANKLLNKGCTVIATSRSFDFTGYKSISSNDLIHQHLDVRDENSVKKLFSWINSINVKVDVLINNAGVGFFKPIIETSLEEWNDMILANLTGSFLCSKEAYKNLKNNGGGRIINIGSIAEKHPLPFNSGYGASKSGLRYLSGSLNEEGKQDKIRVTHITLGATNTDIWQTRTEFKKEDMLNPEIVADSITNIALMPLDIRIDNVEILPPKGVL